MSKNTVDIANALLAEKAALEARVKVLGVENLALRESLDAAEEELARLKVQEPVGEVAMMDYATTRDNGLVWITLSVKADKANSISLNDKMFSAAPAKPRQVVLPNLKKWQDVEGELTDFGKAVFAGGYNQAIADATALGCQPQVVPEGWEACSPEWIERNGSCSCAEAPRIAFGNTGTHYHPAVFDGGKQKRFVVKMPPVQRIGDNPDSYFNEQVYDAEETREAIKAAGGEIAE